MLKVLEQEFEEDYGYSLKEYPKIEDRLHSTSSLSVKMGLIMELLESIVVKSTLIGITPMKNKDVWSKR